MSLLLMACSGPVGHLSNDAPLKKLSGPGTLRGLAGKPEGIHLLIGRRPSAAFGNTGGDREMLEYTGAGRGARLMMLVLHDDAKREYAYGPAQGLPETKVGAFSQSLYDEAVERGWTVISMKRDWKRVSALFEQQTATHAEYDLAQARLRVAKATVAEAKAMMGYVEIAAPFDGVVTKKWADAGDLATPDKPLVDIEDPSSLQMEADIPETIASHVQKDSRLSVRVDSVSGELEGSVTDSRVWSRLLSTNLDFDRKVPLELGTPFESVHTYRIELAPGLLSKGEG